MGTLRLRNSSRSYVMAGTLVRVDPSNNKAFIPSDINKLEVIGVVTANTPPGRMATISLIRDGYDSAGSDGSDGREVEIQKGETHIQWRYVGDTTWTNLVALTEIQGSPGTPGAPGTDGDDGEDGAPGQAGASGTNDIGIVIDGGTSVLTTGIKGYRRIPGNFTITGWTIIGDVSGNCVVDVKKTTYATFPTSASIAGSEKPTLSGAQKNQLLTLTTWSASLSLGDIIEFNIESVSTIKKLYLYIHLTHA